MTQATDEYDSPWKEVLEVFFRYALLLLFREIHDDIDWPRGIEFLDTELQQITWDAELGRGIVDKLVKVWRKNGQEAWVLLHVEIQVQAKKTFSKRMYIYNYRIFDRFDHRVVSLAILADDRADWRPDRYGYALWGFEAGIRFPIAKLVEFRQRWQELEASDNPFAVVVMAHLKTLETRGKPRERLRWKVWMLRRLYEMGLDRDGVLQLFRFIDWVMRLPANLEQNFHESVRQIEDEKKMPYITPFEQNAIDRGTKQGAVQIAQDILRDILETRYGPIPESLITAIATVQDPARLRALNHIALVAGSLEEFWAGMGS